ncbi:MAG: hypothetical protein Q4D62_14975, partial [Planctomycetia bacterium]|nr:hypothetical protein [Planctomycetia bacterium]
EKERPGRLKVSKEAYKKMVQERYLIFEMLDLYNQACKSYEKYKEEQKKEHKKVKVPTDWINCVNKAAENTDFKNC